MQKKTKERAAASAVAAVASAGILVGGAFSSPADLLTGDDDGFMATAPLVQSIDASDDGGDAGAPDEDDEEGARRRSVRGVCRGFILSLPVGVRAVIGLPLWCVGWVLLTGLSMLWTGMISPIAGTLLGWLCLAIVLLCVFTGTVKAMFPDLPLKKILNKRSILTVIIGVALLGLTDTVLPLFWEGYAGISAAVRLAGSFIAVLIPTGFLASREVKKRRREAAEAERERLDALARVSQEDALRHVRELADSVC